jgi:hypothetical protein
MALKLNTVEMLALLASDSARSGDASPDTKVSQLGLPSGASSGAAAAPTTDEEEVG